MSASRPGARCRVVALRRVAALVALLALAAAAGGCVWVRGPVIRVSPPPAAAPASRETTAAVEAKRQAALTKSAEQVACARAAVVSQRSPYVLRAMRSRVVTGPGGVTWAAVLVHIPGMDDPLFVLKLVDGAWKVLGFGTGMADKRPSYGVPADVWRMLVT